MFDTTTIPFRPHNLITTICRLRVNPLVFWTSMICLVFCWSALFNGNDFWWEQQSVNLCRFYHREMSKVTIEFFKVLMIVSPVWVISRAVLIKSNGVIEIKVWVTASVLGVITYSCMRFKCFLTKPPLKLGMDEKKISMFYCFMWL